MTEQQLAAKVVEWLCIQHWDVYQEVQIEYAGKVADIVAVRGPVVWVVECKRSLSLSVIAQANRWYTIRRSVAVPHINGNSKGRDFAFMVCARFNIGILVVNKFGVSEQLSAPLLRKNKWDADRMRAALTPEHKTWANAGSANHDHYTPYKYTIRQVQQLLTKTPGLTLKEIIREVKHHYSADPSAISSLRQALSTWESDWCVIDTSEKPYRYFVKDLKTERVSGLA